MLAIDVAAEPLWLNSFYGSVRAASLRQDLSCTAGKELRADASAQRRSIAHRRLSQGDRPSRRRHGTGPASERDAE